MPDTSSLDAPSGTAALVSETPVTAGQLLRAARQKAGVHLAVLSVTLKVPVKALEALENDQTDPQKGPVFARALASSVCRHLRMDPVPVLALLPPTHAHLAPQRMVSELSSSARAMGSRNLLSPGIRPRHAVLAALMLVTTAALIWLPAPSQWAWPDQLGFFKTSAEAAVATAPEPVFMAQGAVAEPLMSASDQAVSQAASVMVSSMPVASAPVVAAATAVAPSALVTAPQTAASAPAALPTKELPAVAKSSGELAFTTTEASWIEVRDAQKQVLWSSVLQPGEKKSLQGAAPMSVVVGRAQGVTVTWRGLPFDLKPHTQVTVARFELKP